MRSPLLRLPPILLAVLLQLAPLARWFSQTSLLAPTSSWAVVFKLSAGLGALLGSVDAVSGASNTVIAISGGTARPGTNGVAYTLRMDLSGEHQTEAANWTARGLPAGINLTGTASRTRFLTGTPTLVGSNFVTITATNASEPDKGTALSFPLIIHPAAAGGDPPTLLSSPTSRRGVPGFATTFSASANGTAPLRFQWRKDAANLADQTNTTLLLTNLSAGDAGAYSVVVTNGFGSITSAPALLVLATRPALMGSVEANEWIVRFPGETGVVYQVESSPDLAADAWTVSTNLSAPLDELVSFTNSLSPTGALFFRLRMVAP